MLVLYLIISFTCNNYSYSKTSLSISGWSPWDLKMCLDVNLCKLIQILKNGIKFFKYM